MVKELPHRQSTTLKKPFANSGLQVLTTCAEGADESLATLLRDNGMHVRVAGNAHDLYHLIATETFALVLLAGLPAKENSLDVCRRLRGATSVPIIMLTAIGREIEGLQSLENGADEYLSKPFSNGELLARINAVLCRARIARPAKSAGHRTGFSFDDWILDSPARSLQSVTGARTPLPSGEFNLLTVFCERPNCVVSRAQLVDELHKKGDLSADSNLDVYVYRLRRQIEYNAQQPVLIESVPSGGYLFTPLVNPL